MAESTRNLSRKTDDRAYRMILAVTTILVGALLSYWGLRIATDNYVNYVQPSVSQFMVTVFLIIVSFICYWHAGRMFESLNNHSLSEENKEKGNS